MLLDSTDSSLSQMLLFSNSFFDINEITKIINSTINYILLTKRFDDTFL